MRDMTLKLGLYFLPADEEGSWKLLPILVSFLSGGSLTREDLFLYTQDDRSGLKKLEYYTNHSFHQRSFP